MEEKEKIIEIEIERLKDFKELNAHDGAYYRRWASVYGESMVTLIDRILRSVKHEEQAYKSCL